MLLRLSWSHRPPNFRNPLAYIATSTIRPSSVCKMRNSSWLRTPPETPGLPSKNRFQWKSLWTRPPPFFSLPLPQTFDERELGFWGKYGASMSERKQWRGLRVWLLIRVSYAHWSSWSPLAKRLVHLRNVGLSSSRVGPSPSLELDFQCYMTYSLVRQALKFITGTRIHYTMLVPIIKWIQSASIFPTIWLHPMYLVKKLRIAEGVMLFSLFCIMV